MNRLLDVMRRLRAPDGCPWDQKQTHESLRPYLLEEAAEAVDAISDGQPQDIAEELGDVLLQIAFHTVIAEETDAFSYNTIESSIVDKLIRRHPHVFGDTNVADADEVVTNWQAIKEKEGKLKTPADQVPRSLPALMRAYELGKKLEWDTSSTDDAVETTTQTDEITSESIGNMLMAVVDLARTHKINPEIALREAADARATKG